MCTRSSSFAACLWIAVWGSVPVVGWAQQPPLPDATPNVEGQAPATDPVLQAPAEVESPGEGTSAVSAEDGGGAAGAGSAQADGSEHADTADAATSGIQEILVTAQKREERMSRVPMSITALSADNLADRNVTGTEDLGRLVTGFQYALSPTGAPVYSIRGIGFNDTSTAARPTVSVYLDQLPLPFSVESKGAGMDLQRVEVLKGPQGTLFGSNSTGGAVNYIAAKPTANVEYGSSLSLGNFNATQVDVFASGALAPTVNARIAVQRSTAHDWQKSESRSDSNGEKDFTAVRLLADWMPTGDLKVRFNLNGWADESDSQAAQFLAFRPTSPNYVANIPLQYQDTPADHDNRSADWTPGVDYAHNDSLLQGAVTADYNLTDRLLLTSLTSYVDYDSEYIQDPDGSEFRFFQFGPESRLKTFFQELRLSGDIAEGLKLIAGVNYQKDDVNLNLDERLSSTASYGFTPLGAPQFTHVDVPETQQVDTLAGFVNFDYALASALTLHAGVRYTDSDTDFTACTADGGDGAFSTGYSIVISAIRARNGLGPASFAPGECGTLIAETLLPGKAKDSLKENNTSWRGGVDWQVNDASMLYANVSKGYKAGSFPLLGATNSLQYEPAKQESVIAYETGVKSTLFSRLQMTGAVFHYDYRDKQIFGVFIDETFGALKREVNVPKAKETGAELQFNWLATDNLTVSGGVTYLDSEFVTDYDTPTVLNTPANIKGDSFPFTPKWQGNLDLQYEWSLANGWRPFVGASAYSQGKTNAELGELEETKIDAYSLFDLRSGLRSPTEAWMLSLWVKNVGDEYYWNNATLYHDTVVRFTGMPRTYGLRVAYRFQ
ncbi:MAG TPA: TonB-dependent receptor [Vicinamibacterales bacterium]|nr:TonB-dependent receptor [Vicinamibacterales bacterium]